MVETAAYLADHVILRLPVRQWVFAVPKWLRYYLERDPAIQNAALRILLNAIQKTLRRCSLGASAASHIGVVDFIHRIDALLNAHLHFHCVVVDGVFNAVANGGVAFHVAGGLNAQAITAAAFRLTPRYASRRTSAMAWSACCASVPARPLCWNVCARRDGLPMFNATQ